MEGEAKQFFIHQGKCGLAFEPENPDELFKTIMQLYHERNLLKQLGENGRQYVGEKFNRDKIADEFYMFMKKHESEN